MTGKIVSSIWLVPSAADTERLQPFIDEIAAQQNGVSFQPHLTLGSLQTRTPDLTRFSGEGSAMMLDPIEIDATPSFTTSLFIRFSTTPALEALRARLEKEPAFRASRAFDPHLSLCYGAPPEDFARKERYSQLLEEPISYDALWAVEIALPVADYDTIRSWRVTEKHTL